MHLTFSPVRMDECLTLSRCDDVLTINGEAFDFTPLPEGATLPKEAVGCPWLASDIERMSGVLHLTLILPHGSDPARDVQFPDPARVSRNGDIAVSGQTASETGYEH